MTEGEGDGSSPKAKPSVASLRQDLENLLQMTSSQFASKSESSEVRRSSPDITSSPAPPSSSKTNTLLTSELTRELRAEPRSRPVDELLAKLVAETGGLLEKENAQSTKSMYDHLHNYTYSAFRGNTTSSAVPSSQPGSRGAPKTGTSERRAGAATQQKEPKDKSSRKYSVMETNITNQLRDQVKKQEDKLRHLSDKNSQLLAKLQGVQKAKTRLADELKKKEEQCKAAEDKASHFRSRLKKEEEHVARLMSEAKAKDEKIGHLSQRLSHAEDTLQHFDKELDNASLVRKLKGELAELGEGYTTTVTQLRAEREKFAKMEAELKKKDDMMRFLSEENRALYTSNHATDEGDDDDSALKLKEEIHEKEERLQELMEKVQIQEGQEIEIDEEVVEEMSTVTESLKELRNRASKSSASLKTRFEKLQKELEAVKEREALSMGETKGKELELQVTSDKLRVAQKKLKRIEEEKKSVESDLHQKEKQLLELANENTMLTDRLMLEEENRTQQTKREEEEHIENEKLPELLTTAQERLDAAAKDLESKDEKILILTEEFHELVERLRAEELENRKLRQEFKQLTEDVKGVYAENEQMRKLNAQAADLLEELQNESDRNGSGGGHSGTTATVNEHQLDPVKEEESISMHSPATTPSQSRHSQDPMALDELSVPSASAFAESGAGSHNNTQSSVRAPTEQSVHSHALSAGICTPRSGTPGSRHPKFTTVGTGSEMNVWNDSTQMSSKSGQPSDFSPSSGVFSPQVQALKTQLRSIGLSPMPGTLTNLMSASVASEHGASPVSAREQEQTGNSAGVNTSVIQAVDVSLETDEHLDDLVTKTSLEAMAADLLSKYEESEAGRLTLEAENTKAMARIVELEKDLESLTLAIKTAESQVEQQCKKENENNVNIILCQKKEIENLEAQVKGLQDALDEMADKHSSVTPVIEAQVMGSPSTFGAGETGGHGDHQLRHDTHPRPSPSGSSRPVSRATSPGWSAQSVGTAASSIVDELAHKISTLENKLNSGGSGSVDTGEVTALREKLHDTNINLVKDEAKITSLEEQLTKEQSKNRVTKENLDKLRNKNSELLARVQVAEKAKVEATTEMVTKIEEAEKDKEELKTKLDELLKAYEEKVDECQTVSDNLKSVKTDFQQFQNSVSNERLHAVQDAMTWEQRESNLATENKQLKEQINLLKEEVDRLTTVVELDSVSKHKAQEIVQTLDNELGETKKQVKDLEQSLSSSRHELSQLKRGKEDLAEMLNHAERDLQSTRKNLVETEEELNASRTQLQQVEAGTEAALRKAMEASSQLQGEVVAAVQEKDSALMELENEKSKLREELELTRSQLNVTEKEKEMQDSMLRDSRLQMESLATAKVSDDQSVIRSLREENSSLMSELEEKEKMLSTVTAEAKATQDTLARTLKSSDETLFRERAKYAQLQDTCDDKNEEIVRLVGQVKTLQHQIGQIATSKDEADHASDETVRLAQEELDVLRHGLSTLLSRMNGILKTDGQFPHLALAGLQLGTEGLKHISDGLSHNSIITSLDLSNVGLKDRGAKVVGKVLQESVSLEELNLSQNSISDKGVKAVVEGVKANESSRLVSLALDQNVIGNSGFQHLGSICGGQSRRVHKLDDSASLPGLTRGPGGPGGGNRGASVVSMGSDVLSPSRRSTNSYSPLSTDHRSHAGLEELSVAYNRITEAGVREFLHTATKTSFSTTSSGCRLSLLRLTGNSIGPEGGERIAELLRTFPSLEKLAISECHLMDSGCAALFDALCWTSLSTITKAGGRTQPSSKISFNSTLKILELDGNRMSPTSGVALGEVLKSNKTIQSVSIAENNIGDEGLKGIAKGLAQNAGGCHTINLYNNNIGAEGASALAFALAGRAWKPNGRGLASVLLANNNIESGGCEELAKSLMDNDSVTLLDLQSNSIGEKGCVALAEALSSPKGNSTVEALCLQENEIGDIGANALGKMLSRNSAISSVKLRENGIGDQGTRGIADALYRNTSVVLLDLAWNNIGKEGARTLADSICDGSLQDPSVSLPGGNKSLTALNLSGNGIGDSGAHYFGDALKANSTLLTLKMKCNNIGDEGAKALSVGLSRNKTLSKVDLRENGIEEDGVDALEDSMKRNKTLKIRT